MLHRTSKRQLCLFMHARLGLSHPEKQSDDICIYAALIPITKTWSATNLGVT